MRPRLKGGKGLSVVAPVTPAPGQWRQADPWGLLASMPNLICKLQDNTNKQKLSWVSPEKNNS